MPAEPLRVVAQMDAKPGHEAELKAALAELAAPTRSEAGCLGWELYEDASNKARFVAIELWQSEAALAAHLATPHILEAARAGASLLAAPPDIRTFRKVI